MKMHKDAMQHLISGNAILFLGAGFSVGATNISNEKFLAGGDLSKRLCKEMGIRESDDLKNVSNLYIKKNDPDILVDKLKNLYTTKEYAPYQKDVLLFPWQRIYTTNYDDISEKVYSDNGVSFQSATLSDNPRDFSGSKRLILHINGSITNLTKEKLFSEFKLTSTSYLTTEFIDSDWNSYFVQDVHSAGAIFFIGYSLYDIDIARLLFPEKELRQKTHFITSTSPDPIAESTIQDFGHYHPIGTKTFATDINKFASENKPTEASSYTPLFNFSKIKKDDYKISHFRDSYANDLMQYGKVRPYFIFKSIAEKDFFYFLNRSSLSKILNSIKHGITNIVLHSDLGNGKTMAIEGLKCLLCLDGYHVFEAIDFNNKIYEDIENIVKQNIKTAIIFDGYIPYLKAIKSVELKRHKDVVLILSARSVAHEIYIDKLSLILRSPWKEHDLNLLDNSEVAELCAILQHYGFLTTGDTQSRRIIERKYHRHMADVILDRIGSDHISKAISETIANINSKQHYYEILCLTFILNVMGFKIKTHHLTDILGHSIADYMSFRTDQAVKQFININESKVHVKSSILSKYILSNIVSGRMLADTLIKVMTKLDNLSRPYQYYFELCRSLMMYSQIQLIFPENQKLDSIEYYYESIKNLHFTRKNPLFWLQYGISTYIKGDFAKAEHHFKASFEYADRIPNFDKFQIENQYAHFLLKRSIENFDGSRFFDVFKRANDILSKQMGREKRYYPYRVATHYEAFYEKYNSFFSKEMTDYFVSSCKFILERISLLKGNLKQNRYVTKARSGLESVLQKIEDPS